MTNYEHYRQTIDKITRMGRMVAVEEKTGKVTSCNQIECPECKFYAHKDCDTSVFAWADAEYIESEVDWSKVAVDTPILVSNNNVDWSTRHFAKYADGKVRAWVNGNTSYTTDRMFSWEYAKLAEVE